MIRVARLGYQYSGGKEPAIKGLDFHVDEGEIFGFLGPSGAGKSTTQKILIGLLAGYQGEAEVCGRCLSNWRPDDYRHIGVSFENPNHFSKLTGRENLRYFAGLYPQPTRDPIELLTAVGLEADADRPVGHYSKGMKVRLGLARSLIGNPKLLFLDEPTAGLDPGNADRVIALIQAERQAGRTVFLTSHDMNAVTALCDRVAFLVDGRIVCLDSPRALKLQHGQRSLRVEYRNQGVLASTDFPLDGLASNSEFLALLGSHEIETMHSREAALADIFIKLTGRTLA